MNFTLSASDKLFLENYRRNSKNKRHYVKCTVLLNLDRGISVDSLSEILGLDRSTIYNYQNDYLSSGISDFLSDNYLGFWGKLDSFQLATLNTELRNRLYKSSSEVAHWIYEKFNVHYDAKGLVSLLHRLGFSYKKTKLIPAKADIDAQSTFLVDMLDKIEHLDTENEVFLFCDSVHPQWNTRSSYGWIPTGEEHEIKSVSGRKRINLTGTVNVDEPSDVIIEESSTVNKEVIIAFLQKVVKCYSTKKKIYIVVDRASYFTANLVKEWIKDSPVELLYLPAYSPNLNLIERLWKFMRKKVIDTEYYETFALFRTKVLSFFQHIDDYIDELETLLVPNFHVKKSKTKFY